MIPIRPDYLAFGRPNFSEDEIAAVSRVMRSGWIGMGDETATFETELAQYVEAPHVVTVNSCTSALFLSLLVAGVTSGDEVICPSLTWCSTANAALYLGAVPRLCDVDPDTFCVTPDTIKSVLSPKTRAVVVVHFGGFAVDVRALRAALPAEVAIIEDAAHALGARYPDGRPVGSSGNLTCFSFYANKNLSTGEGGAIAVFDDAAAQQLKSLRQHGLSTDAWRRFIDPSTAFVPQLEMLGYKMNFTDLQASIGRVQLARQPELQERRQQVVNEYIERLQSAPLVFQRGLQDESHARHLAVIRFTDPMPRSRNDIVLALRARNIGASVHYEPLHRIPLYAGCAGELPHTTNLADRIMTLPISGSIEEQDVQYVCDHLYDVLART